MRLLLVLAVLVLAGCGTGGPSAPRPGSELLPAEVLAFDAAGMAHEDVVEISDEPILWPAFDGMWGVDQSDEPAPDKPGMTYLAVSMVTGCRVPLDVRVTRTGPSLKVAFTGGDEPQTCYRAVGPSVLLALRETDVAGVRTVNGLTPSGPEELTALVPLGTAPDLDESGSELGLDPLYGELEAAGADNLPDVRAALEADVPDGFLGLAFVAAGCLNTGAVLVLDDPVTVELTGNAGASCEVPEYFLVTFEVPAEYVPEGAVPGGR